MLSATQAKALRTRPLFTANDKNGSGVFSATSQSRAVLSLLSSAKTTSESGGLRDQSDRAGNVVELWLPDSSILRQLQSPYFVSLDRVHGATML